MIELVRGLVTQGLMRAHRLVGEVPGQESLLPPAQAGGEVLHLVELLLVGAEATLNAPVTVRVVRSVEVVGQLEFCYPGSKLLQELASPVRLYGLDFGRGIGPPPASRIPPSW